MIVVNMEKTHINVSGHADYAEKGKDIVCAAVSVLLLTLIRSFEDLTDDKVSHKTVPGSSVVRFKDLSEKGEFLVDSFFVGICMLANTYPDHVRIE